MLTTGKIAAQGHELIGAELSGPLQPDEERPKLRGELVDVGLTDLHLRRRHECDRHANHRHDQRDDQFCLKSHASIYVSDGTPVVPGCFDLNSGRWQ